MCSLASASQATAWLGTKEVESACPCLALLVDVQSALQHHDLSTDLVAIRSLDPQQTGSTARHAQGQIKEWAKDLFDELCERVTAAVSELETKRAIQLCDSTLPWFPFPTDDVPTQTASQLGV